MIFAIRLLDRAPEASLNFRRRLRGRNHLFAGHGWPEPAAAANTLAALLAASLRKGGRAAAGMAVPIGVVQAVMIALVAAIFGIAPVEAAFQKIVDFKIQLGLPFAFLSMGVIAICAEGVRRIGRPREPFWGAAAYGFAVFGFLGVATDLFCGIQDRVWGPLPQGIEVVMKMLTDQFLYTVVFANPYQTLLMVWKDCGFFGGAFARRTRPFPEFYVREMLPVLVTNWAYWIPTTLVLYCLPGDIQFVIRLFAIVIWILLLTALTKRN
jgi:hypothetical protein